MKLKEISVSKGVTMGMPNYGSVRVEVSATATECTHEEVSKYVSEKLQIDIDTIINNVGQNGKRYIVNK